MNKTRSCGIFKLMEQRGFIKIILVLIIIILLIISIFIAYRTFFLANESNQVVNRAFVPPGQSLNLPNYTPQPTSYQPSPIPSPSQLNPSALQVTLNQPSPSTSASSQTYVAQRAHDLKAIAAALQVYHSTYQVYPSSGLLDGTQNAVARSECPQWGGYPSDQVVIDLSGKSLPPLVPRFISQFPSDPQMLRASSISCYVYLSNGTDFKIRTSAANQFMSTADFNSQPDLIDPKYNGQASPCGDTNKAPTAWAIESSDAVKCW